MKLEWSVLVAIVVVLVASVLLILLTGKFAKLDTSVTQDIATCKQQALVATYARVPITRQLLTDYQCPTTFSSITAKDLQKPSAIEQKEAAAFGIADLESYQLQKMVWEQTDNCWNKMNYGNNELFSKNRWDFEQWISSQDGVTFCTICSIVQVDDSLIDKNVDSSVYFSQKKVSGEEVSLKEILMQASTDDVAIDITPLTHPQLKLAKRIAFVYVRTNYMWYQKTLVEGAEKYGPYYLLTTFPLPALITWASVGSDAYFQEPVPTKDVQTVIPLRYDEATGLPMCDILATPFEKAEV
jgi:hypothetical protein